MLNDKFVFKQSVRINAITEYFNNWSKSVVFPNQTFLHTHNTYEYNSLIYLNINWNNFPEWHTANLRSIGRHTITRSRSISHRPTSDMATYRFQLRVEGLRFVGHPRMCQDPILFFSPLPCHRWEKLNFRRGAGRARAVMELI